MCINLSSACSPSTLRSSFYSSALWGLDPMSGATTGAEGAPTSSDYTSTDPSGYWASREHAGRRDQSSAQTSCANMKLTDQTLPVKGRNSVHCYHILSNPHVLFCNVCWGKRVCMPLRGVENIVHTATATLQLCIM